MAIYLLYIQLGVQLRNDSIYNDYHNYNCLYKILMTSREMKCYISNDLAIVQVFVVAK